MDQKPQFFAKQLIEPLTMKSIVQSKYTLKSQPLVLCQEQIYLKKLFEEAWFVEPRVP